jgi:hypothetical protein
MLILMLLLFALFALSVIFFLVQYRSYNRSHKKIFIAGTPLTEECDATLQTEECDATLQTELVPII